MSDPAFDITALSAKHVSEASARRLKRRHWAEVRLRLYGILAIVIAVTALLILIYTVVSKTLSVSTEYYLSLDVPIQVTDQQMERITDSNPRLIPALDKPVRASLRTAVGGDVGRKERRQLNGLMSQDAGYELGQAVKADPDLIGEVYRYDALLDDQMQLYMQGYFGELREARTTGDITVLPGADDDEVQIEIGRGVLTEARQLMQADRSREARAFLRTESDQARAVSETEAALNAATSDEERASLTTALESFRAQREATAVKAEAAQTAATDLSHVFTLRSDDPTVFIRVDKGWIKVTQMAPESVTGIILDPIPGTGQIAAGGWGAYIFERPEAERKVNDRQVLWLENLDRRGKIEERFNWRVLTAADSSNAELAGIWGALVGSFWTMIVTFLLAFPIGVMASIYLEEFAPKNRLTQMIEININNLAAVPSIVFGLFGITVLISGVNLFGIDLFDGVLKAITNDPRSTPLVGGVVLALMSLPTIIIASRASIKAVPGSIRDAALGLGASKLQTSTHHVLPLAMPGILTGSIIAMAQALGETAPLIIVGMNAFIQDPPAGPLDKSTVLPSLIYLWNNQAERLFDGKTAVAISVLLLFLILMNALAVMLRRRFERRW
ncbi:MAG: phosphate ABC transporter permease PstA [Pseudomonadota bacterium]